MAEKKEPQAQATRRPPRRRNRLAPDSRSHRLSRPLSAALIVILAGGAYLFWPRGGSAPVGLGEQISVITADTTSGNLPRSGSVEIDEQVQPLVPEEPETGAETQPSQAGTRPASEPPAAVTPPPARPQPRPQPRPEPEPAAEPVLIQPESTGGWAVQIGAYGNEGNAEKVAAQLRDQGISAQVRAASTSGGELIYRVWIGWFKSRDQALAYARQEKPRIGDAHPVHR